MSDSSPLEPIATDLLAALATPAFFARGGRVPARVEHVQTHISHVFLVGEDVYKLKKAVRFPFLDFGTRDRRRFYCAEELRLNRRLAGPVYVDVLPILRRADGTLVLGAEPLDAAGRGRDGDVSAGALVEPVLHMRRLPAAGLLPELLAAGAVDRETMGALARRIAAFHRAAPTGPAVATHASPAALRRRFADILDALRPFVGGLVQADEHAALVEFADGFVAAHEPLLVARQEASRIREGHGDLHAEHVCFVGDVSEWNGEGAGATSVAAPPATVAPAATPASATTPGRATTPAPAASATATSAAPPPPAAASPLPPGIYVFDCIEFSEAFRCNDVASEVAFLTMDLEARGHRELGDAFAAAYVAAAADSELLALVPYYAAFRACVRATVAALTSAEAEVDAAERDAARDRAERYVALALRSAWRAAGPALVVCCGLSGTGKSTLAAGLAAATDAVVLRSDVIRKRDVAPASAHVSSDRYAPAARAAVYAELVREAEQHLASGRTVIADATFLRRADRDAAVAAAARQGRRVVFVETVAASATVERRLAARAPDDVSDARVETYRGQRATVEPWGDDEPRIVVTTDDGTASARARAVRALFAWRRTSA